MSDRNDRPDRRSPAPPPSSATPRDDRAADSPGAGIPGVDRENEESTPARPRGHTEEPDRTL
jgi:hypothetical protein